MLKSIKTYLQDRELSSVSYNFGHLNTENVIKEINATIQKQEVSHYSNKSLQEEIELLNWQIEKIDNPKKKTKKKIKER